jgi:Tol biopolymer transport system component
VGGRPRLRHCLVGAAVCAFATTALVACGGSARPRPDLLFVSTKSGSYAIYEMNQDGGRQRRLTNGHGDLSQPGGQFYEIDPAWSPSAAKVAFASTRSGTFEIYVMDASGRNVTELTSTAAENTHPSFSPDGKHIVFARGGRIWVMNADGFGAHRVTRGANAERDPAWSPDGKWIAYTHDYTGTPVREIWLVHPDGSAAHRLTSFNASANTPAWSPDSRQIAFSDDARGLGFKVWVIGVGGIGIRRLTSSPAQELDPAWSPDGKTIAFSSDGSIVTVPVGKTDVTTLTNSKDNDSSPAWNPVQAPAKKGY